MRYFWLFLQTMARSCPFTEQIDADLAPFDGGISEGDMNYLKGDSFRQSVHSANRFLFRHGERGTLSDHIRSFI